MIDLRKFTRMPFDILVRHLPGRTAHGASLAGMEVTSADTTGHYTPAGDANAFAEAISVDAAGQYEPAPENDDPARRRIRQYTYRTRLQRFLRAQWERFFPAPTPEDIRQAEREKERQAMEAVLMEDLSRGGVLLENRLMDIGFYHEAKNGAGGTYRIGPVLGIARATPEELIYRVTDFPPGPGNTILRMLDADVLTMLSEAVGHPVYGMYRKEQESMGMRLVIARAGSRGLPVIYTIQQMLADCPSTAGTLALGLGIMSNGRPLWRNLDDMPHMIVAGSTKGGKSNLLHAIICTLIHRNAPDAVQLDLGDFKDQGLEFSVYDGIPHLRSGSVITDPASLKNYFSSLLVEMGRRYRILSSAKKRNIGDFNRKRIKERLPYLVAIFDEWGDVVNTLGEQEANKVLYKIASQGRAAGIHLIAATQYPRSDVIDPKVTMNMQARVCFSVPQSSQSMVVIGSPRAHTDIGPTERGRAIFAFGAGDEHIIQCPLVTDRQIAQFAEAARTGATLADPGISLDPEELIRWAMEKNQNRLDQKSTFDTFRERIAFDDLVVLLKTMDGQVYDINGTAYIVINKGGSSPRRVELYTEANETPPEGHEAPESPIINNQLQVIERYSGTFRDDLRAVLAAHECILRDDAFQAVGVLIELDETLFDIPLPELRTREKSLVKDLKALCKRHNARPVKGGFEIDNEVIHV